MLLMLLTLSAMMPWVAAYDGEAEKSCTLDNIPVLPPFDNAMILGKWFPVYKTHFPPYFDGVTLMWYNMEALEFVDPHRGVMQLAVANRTSIFQDRSCSSELVAYDVSQPNIWRAPYTPVPRQPGDPPVAVVTSNTAFILGVGKKTLAFYHEVLLNGVVSKLYSSVAVMVRDLKNTPSQPDLSEVEDGLVKLCGQEVKQPGFFKRRTFNPSAKCTTDPCGGSGGGGGGSDSGDEDREAF